MNISEQISTNLQTIAENEQKVFDAGYEKGKSEGGDLNAVNYAKVIQFTDDDWAESDTVEIDIPNVTTLNNLFNGFWFKKIQHLIIRTEKPITSCRGMFWLSGDNNTPETLTTITLEIDTSQCTDFSSMFYKCRGLVEIKGNPLDFSSATSIGGLNNYSNKIQSFRVVAGSIKVNINVSYSQMLTAETIQSVIDGLADLTGSTAQTITWSANVKAKLTDEQKATITGKNWTIA